jgi:hypothetical protein
MGDANDLVATFGKPWDRGLESNLADGCSLCPRFSALQLIAVEPSLRVLSGVQKIDSELVRKSNRQKAVSVMAKEEEEEAYSDSLIGLRYVRI